MFSEQHTAGATKRKPLKLPQHGVNQSTGVISVFWVFSEGSVGSQVPYSPCAYKGSSLSLRKARFRKGTANVEDIRAETHGRCQ